MSEVINVLFYENWEFYTSITSILATAGLGLVVWNSTKKFNINQHEIANHQLQKELFSEFNKRYDILNGYLKKITLYNSLEDLRVNNPEKELFLRNKLNDYFNLCAEEYYWYKKGRIDTNLWKSWEVGMNSWYSNHNIIREAWEEEYNSFGYQSFYLSEKDEHFFKKV